MKSYEIPTIIGKTTCIDLPVVKGYRVNSAAFGKLFLPYLQNADLSKCKPPPHRLNSLSRASQKPYRGLALSSEATS